ncbi:hypothetical protein [Tenuibacillus multivorans]|uniref:Uncharacterized protein n=1 Tax=Tenuibacillus multivorans TaxID=237069 RepID=A0A1G9XQT1_9BACI|nr:hypothetical protein [Tenuibacillus multivorans]GEL75778.1 hypothetical protein TMU01_00130 [Tenuibacillus multivorans]SDM99118.1 hypothetical protein SAMN05216498_1071 [Tenuibacillus multivorans]
MNDEIKDVLEASFEHIDSKFDEIHKRDQKELLKMIKPEVHKIVQTELNKKFDELYEVLGSIYENLKENDK